MAQSQYLAQALQSMGAPAGSPQGTPQMSLQQMQQIAQQKQAWEAANPGQSYMGHGLQQMGQNLMNAPGNVMGAIQNLGQVPGQVANGFQSLAQRFGGGAPAGMDPPY